MLSALVKSSSGYELLLNAHEWPSSAARLAPYAGLLSYCTLLLGRKTMATSRWEQRGNAQHSETSERRLYGDARERVKVNLGFSTNASHVEK